MLYDDRVLAIIRDVMHNPMGNRVARNVRRHGGEWLEERYLSRYPLLQCASGHRASQILRTISTCFVRINSTYWSEALEQVRKGPAYFLDGECRYFNVRLPHGCDAI